MNMEQRVVGFWSPIPMTLVTNYGVGKMTQQCLDCLATLGLLSEKRPANPSLGMFALSPPLGEDAQVHKKQLLFKAYKLLHSVLAH